MSPARPPGRAIRSVPELLAHALAIEREAEERYAELADQMAVHHNAAAEKLFRRLAHIESRHVAQIGQMSGGMELPQPAPWEYRWREAQSPEAIDTGVVHYLLSAHAAVRLALQREIKAEEFYRGVAAGARASAVRRMALELAEEEAEHVRWLEQWLRDTPAPARAAEDPDPPVAQE